MLQIQETMQTKRNAAVNKRKLHSGSVWGTIIGGAPVVFYGSEEEEKYEYKEEEVL